VAHELSTHTEMLGPVLILLAALASPAVADCTYSTLQEASASYVTSQSTGQIGTLPAAATYTENFKTANINTGILSHPLKIDHNRSTYDTTGCATFTELIITDRQHPYVIGTQLHLTDNKISKIDTIITDAGDWLFNATGTLYWAQQENWGTIPVEKRDSRATIQKAADAYLDLFNDKSVVVPWGTPCARLEGGSYTGRGSASDSCNVGVPSGVALVNRRYVIDETVGAVDVFLDFGGSGGIPDTHEFRIQEGKIRYVHTMSVTG